MDTPTDPLFVVAADIEGAGLRERLAAKGSASQRVVTVGVGREGDGGLRTAIERTRPGGIVSPGLAGALDPTLRPGDVVVVHGWVDTAPPHARTDGSDRELRGRVEAALTEAGIEHRSGLAVTVDAPLHDRDRRRVLHERARAAVVEMEGGRWARICAEAGVPFVSVRVISDDAATPLPLPRHLLLERSGRIRWSRWLRAIARDGVPTDAERQLQRLFRARDEWIRAMAALDAVADALAVRFAR